MKICIAQINYNSDNIQEHLDKIKQIITAHRSSDLIVFPELILHGHPSVERPEGFLYRRMRVIYRSISEVVYQHVRDAQARVIIGESKRWGEKYYNVATYIDQNTVGTYSKTHVHWTENFAPGKELMVFDSPFGKIGITICFDSAFSEVWRVLALKGAHLIVNISAVPKTFPVHYMWRRFRGAAVFNQVFVVYANRPGEYFSGHSAVFNPQGDILASAGPTEAVIEADIDLRTVETWREEEKVYPSRRPLLYRQIIRRPRHDMQLIANV